MALAIPSLLLKQLHTFGSLRNTERGVEFSLKNRLSDATVTAVKMVKLDKKEVPREAISLELSNGQVVRPDDLSIIPLDFPLRQTVEMVCAVEHLDLGKHKIEVHKAMIQFFRLVATIGADFFKFSHIAFGGNIYLFNGLWFNVFVFSYKIFDNDGIKNQRFQAAEDIGMFICEKGSELGQCGKEHWDLGINNTFQKRPDPPIEITGLVYDNE